MLSPQKKNFWILLTFLAITLTAFRLLDSRTTYQAYHSTCEAMDSEFRKTTCKKKFVRKHPKHAREQIRLKKDRRRKRCKSSSHVYWVE